MNSFPLRYAMQLFPQGEIIQVSDSINMKRIQCFLRGLVVASSLPHTAKHIKLRYETPSIIIHTVNDSNEDDTIAMMSMTFSSYISILSKNGKDYENGRIKCICREIGSSSGVSRDSTLKRVCGVTIRFNRTFII